MCNIIYLQMQDNIQGQTKVQVVNIDWLAVNKHHF